MIFCRQLCLSLTCGVAKLNSFDDPLISATEAAFPDTPQEKDDEGLILYLCIGPSMSDSDSVLQRPFFLLFFVHLPTREQKKIATNTSSVPEVVARKNTQKEWSKDLGNKFLCFGKCREIYASSPIPPSAISRI
jgi:hypothetical protein